MTRDKSLNGLRVLVTRAPGQSQSFKEKLELLGAKVIEKPLIDFGPPDSWEQLDKAIERLQEFDWIIFASVNAVDNFCKRLSEKNIDMRQSKTKLATVGSTTSDALAKFGLRADFHPSTFIAEHLVQEFPQYPELNGKQILWPKTNIGRLLVAEELEKAGARVEIVNCYKTVPPANLSEVGRDIAQLIENEALDVITLASAQTARHLAEATRLAGISPTEIKWHNVKVVTIGPETSNAFAEQFPSYTPLQATEFTIDGIIKVLHEIQSNAAHHKRDKG